MTKKKMIEGLEFLLNGFEDDETEQIEIVEGAILALKKIDKLENLLKRSNVRLLVKAEMASDFETNVVKILGEK